MSYDCRTNVKNWDSATTRYDSFEHVQKVVACPNLCQSAANATVRPVMAMPSRKCHKCITVYHDFLDRGQ